MIIPINDQDGTFCIFPVGWGLHASFPRATERGDLLFELVTGRAASASLVPGKGLAAAAMEVGTSQGASR